MLSADIAAAQAAFRQHGTKAAAARALGIPVTTLKDRLTAASRPDPWVKGREEFVLENGTAIIFSDAHYWPGEPSTAHRAVVKFANDLQPSLIVCNGDAIDGSSISRHPPIGWEGCPTVKEELEVCQQRLGEIVDASEELLYLAPW